jgi:uncharacterized membrane protein YedE/YeeE
MPSAPDRAAPRRGGLQPLPLALGLAAFAWTAVRLAQDGWRAAALWSIGLLLGLVLYHTSFGFAHGYRRMIVAREMRGVQAQLLLLALTTLLFAPLLAAGTAFGQELDGAWAPLGVPVVAGAFLFGIGMQLAGGCGSGTLYTAGGGSVRMAAVLGAACAGSFWASLHLAAWRRLPALDGVLLSDSFGAAAALALQLLFIAALALLLRRLARAQPAAPAPAKGLGRLLSGPWPPAAGAALLALGNAATLLVDGHPWAITWGFTVWGAKGAMALGWQPQSSEFWRDGAPWQSLQGSVLDDTTSMMDLAIMLGALCAAALAGRFAPRWRVPWPSLGAALIGGLAIGYGARIAYGCNIGAFVSGVASGSVHGWLWLAAALPGSWLGVRLRPRFGLAD